MSKKPSSNSNDGGLVGVTQAMPSRGKLNKKGSMEKHFNFFLKEHWKSTSLTSFESLRPCDVSIELVDTFATYLSAHARRGCKSDGELLSYNTVDQYLSTFKTCLVSKFFYEKDANLVVNDNTKMSQLRQAMCQHKLRLLRQEGREIMTSTDAATDEDVDTFFLLCFWEGSNESAEFLHLMMSCIANCGRGSEVS